jgi:hypothetical protein
MEEPSGAVSILGAVVGAPSGRRWIEGREETAEEGGQDGLEEAGRTAEAWTSIFLGTGGSRTWGGAVTGSGGRMIRGAGTGEVTGSGREPKDWLSESSRRVEEGSGGMTGKGRVEVRGLVRDTGLRGGAGSGAVGGRMMPLIEFGSALGRGTVAGRRIGGRLVVGRFSAAMLTVRGGRKGVDSGTGVAASIGWPEDIPASIRVDFLSAKVGFDFSATGSVTGGAGGGVGGIRSRTSARVLHGSESLSRA